MGAKFSSGGGATVFYDKTDTPGEIVTELVNASDGAGLHFDGAAGNIDVASPPDLGTKASFELVISSATASQTAYIFDFGSGGRTILSLNSGSLRFYSGGWSDFSVSTLDDLKVHHLCVTVDGTAATLYDNGNQIATATLAASLNADSAADLKIGSHNGGSADFFNGTIYRCRFYNKALEPDEVRTAFERADVDYSSQYGNQTSKILNGTSWTGASGTTPPNSWTAGTGQVPNFTIDSSSGSGSEPALKFQRGADNMPYFFQTFTAVIGKKYRVAYRIKNIDAIHVRVGIGSSAVGTQYNVTDYTSTDWADYEDTFTATTTTFSIYVQANTVTGTQGGYIDSVTVEQTGAVVDLDLAFANPSQSRTIQDRSTNNVDGTASTSGVTQVQPVVQLNATSARIGTSAGTPADRELLLDKYLKFSDIYPQVVTSSTASEMAISGGNATFNGANISLRGSTHGTPSSVRFRSGTTTTLTIDSSGNVLVGAAALDANLGAKKMQLEGSASTSVGPEMLLHNPGQGGGAASLLTFGGKASGTEGYTAAIKATNTGTLTIGTAHASGGFSEPGADLTINSDGAVSIPSATAAGSQLTIGNIHGKLTFNNTSGTSGSTIIQQSYTGGTAELRFGSNVSGTGTSAMNISTGNAGLVKFNGGITVSDGLTSLGSFSELTISSGGITVTNSTHKVDTESDAATDNLNTITGGTDGSVLILRSVTSFRDVVVTETDNIHLATSTFTLNSYLDRLVLVKSGSYWHEISRSVNG